MTAPTPSLRLTPSSIVRTVVIVGVFVLVVGVVVRAAHPIMWFIQAAVIAALAWPAVRHLSRHMPSWVAVLVLTGAVALVVGVVAGAGFTELQTESARFRDTVPPAARELERREPLGGLLHDLHVAEQLEKLGDDLAARFQLGEDLPGLATAVGGGVSAVFVVWVLTVMLVFTGPGMVESAVGATSPGTRELLGPALRAAYRRALRYLALTSARAVVVGAVVYVAALALSVDMPALLAVTAAMVSFVPYVGVVIGALPLALLSILNSPGEAAAVLAVAVVAQVVDSVVVQPRIHRASFAFGMLPTLVVAMVGMSLYGVIGLLVGLALGTFLLALLLELDRDQALWDRSSRAATSSSTDAGAPPDAMSSSTDSSSSATSPT